MGFKISGAKIPPELLHTLIQSAELLPLVSSAVEQPSLLWRRSAGKDVMKEAVELTHDWICLLDFSWSRLTTSLQHLLLIRQGVTLLAINAVGLSDGLQLSRCIVGRWDYRFHHSRLASCWHLRNGQYPRCSYSVVTLERGEVWRTLSEVRIHNNDVFESQYVRECSHHCSVFRTLIFHSIWNHPSSFIQATRNHL